MHRNPIAVSEPPLGDRTAFTRGGISAFGFDQIKNVEHNQFAIKNLTNSLENHMHGNRSGWYGWFGLGGSVFQWHPEKKVGFAYVPSDLFWTDFVDFKASKIQKQVIDIIK